MIFYENSEEAGKTQSPLSHDIREYEQTARKSASAGQLLTAIEVARDGIKRYGKNRILQQQLALALAQTGALDGAREILRELLEESDRDEETLCLKGRVFKEMWRRSTCAASGAAAIEQSCRFYREAFTINSAYYPGINLAFTLAASGQLKEAQDIAGQVEKTCRREIEQAGDQADGWVLATMAEAHTHLGATTAAAKYYRRAATQFAGRWRDLASMRKQAREIIGFATKRQETTRDHWYDLASIKQRAREITGRAERGQAWLDACFEFPSVVVFSGHMMDRADRPTRRFPAAAEARVRAEIKAYLHEVRAGFGYGSAACGADLIFCECLLEMDAKVNLVLPCPINAFKRQSVSWAGPAWEQRFLKVLSQAHTTLIASPADYSGSDHDPSPTMEFIYANRIITGLAVLQAQALDFELKALAVWDGAPIENNGGTGGVVGEWQERQLNPRIIVPIPLAPLSGPSSVQTPSILRTTPSLTAPLAAQPPAAAPPPAGPNAVPVPLEIEHTIKALVFAEIINHRKIGERQMPAFIREFKGSVARILTQKNLPPIVAESWGKSQSFIYERLQDAALFALELRDEISQTPWAERGLPADLGIRIVLHAGPVYAYIDPVLQRTACTGLHLSRAARIEPITPPGQVYATQEFAALCSAEDLSAVSFEFLGNLRTAKLMEEAPLYRLDRRRNHLD